MAAAPCQLVGFSAARALVGGAPPCYAAPSRAATTTVARAPPPRAAAGRGPLAPQPQQLGAPATTMMGTATGLGGSRRRAPAVCPAGGRRALRCQAASGFGAMLAKKQKSKKDSKCPCGGGEDKKAYEDCCQPFHKEEAYPEDPVTLMKSRFSAYAKGEVDYICATTHPDNPALGGSKLASGKVVSSFKQDVAATCKKVKFLKLEIKDSEDGKDDTEAFVTFQAVIQVTGQKGFKQSSFEREVMLEKSRFQKSEEDDGRWLYVDGDVDYVDEA